MATGGRSTPLAKGDADQSLQAHTLCHALGQIANADSDASIQKASSITKRRDVHDQQTDAHAVERRRFFKRLGEAYSCNDWSAGTMARLRSLRPG